MGGVKRMEMVKGHDSCKQRNHLAAGDLVEWKKKWMPWGLCFLEDEQEKGLASLRMHINMTLHDNTGEEKSTNSKNDYSTEEMQENVETDDKRNDTVEATSVTSMPCSSNRIAHDLPPINESKPEEGSFFPESNQEAPGATSTHDRTNSLEEADHNRLLNQYYEIEEKRQKILQQLQQVGYWNDPSSSQYQTPQLHEGTNISNLGLLCPCLSCGHCGGCALNYSSCGTSCPWDACKFLLQSHQISAEMVAERSACSMKFDTPATPNVSEERKHMGNAETSVVDGGQVSQTNEMETEISVVMSAWYSAGFYTGRYLLEQSMKKGSR